MVQYLPSVKAPKMFLPPATSLLSCHQNNLNIKIKPKFLRGICVSPFFAPNSLPKVNILPILNKYLSHEKTRNVLNPFGQHWGSGFPPNSNADFTADLLLLGETFTAQPPKRRSPPQPPTASKVTMEKSTSPPPCSKFGGQKNKNGVNLSSALLFDPLCELKNEENIFTPRKEC